jgi:hypothetical protein
MAPPEVVRREYDARVPRERAALEYFTRAAISGILGVLVSGRKA